MCELLEPYFDEEDYTLESVKRVYSNVTGIFYLSGLCTGAMLIPYHDKVINLCNVVVSVPNYSYIWIV